MGYTKLCNTECCISFNVFVIYTLWSLVTSTILLKYQIRLREQCIGKKNFDLGQPPPFSATTTTSSITTFTPFNHSIPSTPTPSLSIILSTPTSSFSLHSLHVHSHTSLRTPALITTATQITLPSPVNCTVHASLR